MEDCIYSLSVDQCELWAYVQLWMRRWTCARGSLVCGYESKGSIDPNLQLRLLVVSRISATLSFGPGVAVTVHGMFA